MDAKTASGPALSLLIVEDDRVVREVLGLMIPKKFPSVTVIFADGGKEGVELFKRHMPEIVITDIQMAEMDGIEMAGEIKSIKADTRFIALTAYGTGMYRKEMDKLGFHAYLPKPIEFARLYSAIASCIDELDAARPDR